MQRWCEMALENEYMLEELTAEEIYQKKLTAGTNITIDNQNVISATGGGSSVQYTSNYAQGDILGTLSIDGASSAVRTPNLVEGENITITRNQQAGTITISSSAGSGDLSANELTEEAYNALTPAEKTNGDLYLTHPATVGSSEPNKIYYNDTLYGTEGGNDVVELTQAEWDALPSSKLTDGIIYVITDSGGGGGGTDEHAVHVPPVIFDNDGLKKIATIDNFPGIEQIFLTPTAYSNLTTAEKEDLSKIYYVSNYEFYSDSGLILRVSTSNEIKLFVNGFDGYGGTSDAIPNIIDSKLRELKGSYYIGSIGYDSNKDPLTTSAPYVYIDANYSRITFRNASGDYSPQITYPVYSVIDLTNAYQGLQNNPWEDPYDIPGDMTIYYGNKQYTNFDIPRTNSVQVPPVIFDNGELKKINDMTGFPELEKVFITAEEYAQLTTAQKQDLTKIYYVSPYEFYTFKDGEITIRVNGTTYEWFFNGFILTDDYYEIPSEYRQYTKNTPYQGSTAWSDNTSSTSLGIIEMGPSGYTERISAQDGNWGGSYIKNTPMYGKIVTGGGSSQINTYSNPYDVETPIVIYYGNKQYTDFDPLPEVTSTDAGKALVVNSNGVWDKGDIREVPVIGLGDNDKILTVESGEASWSSPKKVTHLYDEIPISNPLYFLGNIDPSTSPLTIDMTQIATNYEELRSTDFAFVFIAGANNAISVVKQYNPINNDFGTFTYNPSTGQLTATLRGGYTTGTLVGIVYKKAIIQLSENAIITGQSGTIDCTDVPNADTLTVSDFGIVITYVTYPSTSNTGVDAVVPTMSYNQTTKQLSWSVSMASYDFLKVTGYVIVGNYGDPEYRLITNFTGATSSSDGYRGYVPAPLAGDENKVLKGDGTWGENANRLILDGHVYSTTEKQIGIWLNEKPIYEKTYELQTAIDVSYNSWSSSGISTSGIEQLINVITYYNSTCWGGSILTTIDHGDFRFQTARNGASCSLNKFVVQYTKSADSAGSGGYQSYGFSPIIYSEEEREVGVWIDNKPLYQITYDAGSNIDVKYNSWTNITINELMGSENIVMGYGTNSGGTYTPLQVSWTGSVGSKIIQVQTPRNSNNQGVRYFTFLYTKTTDVAGSGSYNTLGVPTVHYSTEEQIIGTWTDGRPIYQKIITYDSTINSNTWTTIDNSITTAIVDHFFVDNIDWQYSSYIVGGANTGGGGLSTTLTANGLSLENQTPIAGSNFTLIVKYTKIADIQSS